MATTAVPSITFSTDMTPVTLKRGLIMSVVRANSKPGQSPGDLAYKTALRASVVGFLDAADAGAARTAIKRELWSLDPLHPGDGDAHASQSAPIETAAVM